LNATGATPNLRLPRRPRSMTNSALSYRVGLTHLRALSVVLVLLFHAEVIDAGYIGVDVFFVLSGFLISSILWDGLSGDRANRHVLADFYARRAKRILPLSLLVLAVTAVAARLFFDTLIDNWVSAGRAALIWAENWFLIGQANDYFAPQGTNPFQQYWSLGVEEQFYVVLPLLLALLLAATRRLAEPAKLLVLGVAATAGMVLAFSSAWIFDLSPSEAYYSSFTRSYQLLAGVAIMAFVRRFEVRDDRRWLAAAGVAGLIVVGGLLDLDTTWAGLWATLFAGLCVLSSRAILTDSRWLERLGIWSYGIYLWHFPINEYLANERLDTPPWAVFAITFVTATALAACTFRFFEDPVRHLRVRNAVTFAATGVTIVVLWFALGLLQTPAPEQVFVADGGSNDAQAPLAVDEDGTVDLSPIQPAGRLAADDAERVEGWIALESTSVGRCGLADTTTSCRDLEGQPEVMVIGDSFANRVYQAVRPLAEEQGWGLSAYVRPGCPWMDDVYNDVGDEFADQCIRDKALQEQVVANMDPDVIVIHSYPYREANNKMTRLSTGERLDPDEVAAAANATIDRFVDAGISVVYVEPTPFPADGSNADDCLKVATWADECDFEPIDVDSPLNQAMRDRAETDPDVSFVSINDLFCDDDECSAALGTLAMMGDTTHVSGGIWVKLRNVLLGPIEDASTP
jgi:peptidoglycan/LPS O-acetylase OafA/YrhL